MDPKDNTTTTKTTTKSYVCSGSCGAHITEEQYNGGLTVCGTEACTMKGQPFTEKVIETTEVSQPKSTEEDVIVNN